MANSARVEAVLGMATDLKVTNSYQSVFAKAFRVLFVTLLVTAVISCKSDEDSILFVSNDSDPDWSEFPSKYKLENLEHKQDMNCVSARSGQKINRIVLHHTASAPSDPRGSAIRTLTGCPAQKKYQNSAHILIDRQGNVVRLVDLSKKAWHAGNSNDDSIGIELVATTKNIWPQTGMTRAQALAQDKGLSKKQEESLKITLKYLMNRFNIQPPKPGQLMPPSGVPKQYGSVRFKSHQKKSFLLTHNSASATLCPTYLWPTAEKFMDWRFGVFKDFELGDDPLEGIDGIARDKTPTPKNNIVKFERFDSNEADIRQGDSISCQYEPLLNCMLHHGGKAKDNSNYCIAAAKTGSCTQHSLPQIKCSRAGLNACARAQWTQSKPKKGADVALMCDLSAICNTL